MFIGIALLFTYLIALITAGHGVVPMAVLLVMGDANSWWLVGKITGWIGVVGLISATFLLILDPLRQLTYQLLASIILYLSWLIIAILGNGESGDFWSSFVLSAPFQITFFIIAKRFILQRNQTITDSDDAI